MLAKKIVRPRDDGSVADKSLINGFESENEAPCNGTLKAIPSSQSVDRVPLTDRSGLISRVFNAVSLNNDSIKLDLFGWDSTVVGTRRSLGLLFGNASKPFAEINRAVLNVPACHVSLSSGFILLKIF